MVRGKIRAPRQSHLNDGVDLERQEALMPKALGVT
jgi:hypothetical protein